LLAAKYSLKISPKRDGAGVLTEIIENTQHRATKVKKVSYHNALFLHLKFFEDNMSVWNRSKNRYSNFYQSNYIMKNEL
jgi:hypothetical protein